MEVPLSSNHRGRNRHTRHNAKPGTGESSRNKTAIKHSSRQPRYIPPEAAKQLEQLFLSGPSVKAQPDPPKRIRPKPP